MSGIAANFLFVAAVPIALAVAVFVNFYRLADAPLLGDEGIYTSIGWRYLHWDTLPSSARLPENSNGEHPPLAKLLFGAAQVLAGGPSVTAARAVSAACSVLTAVVVVWWLSRVTSRWVGLLAGAAVALLPTPVFPEVTRFGRAAMLDVVCGLFVVLTLAAGWMWFRTRGGTGWWWAAATGVAVGLATASKINGFLGLALPALVGVFWAWPSWRDVASRIAQAGMAAGIAFGSFALTFLPLGDVLARMTYAVEYQSNHSDNGHLIGLPGQVTEHPPWWANLWFAGQGLGTVLACLVLLTAVVGGVLARDRLTVWCLAALAGPFVFHAFVAGVALPFYWVMWLPPLLVLSARGVGALAFRAGRSTGLRKGALVTAIVATLCVGAGPIMGHAVTVARLQPVGAAVIPELRARLHLSGSIITAGVPPAEMSPLLPGITVRTHVPASLSDVDMIVVGQPRCRTLISQKVRALVAVNLAVGGLRLVHTDRLGRIYAATRSLRLPHPTQVRAQPLGSLTDHC